MKNIAILALFCLFTYIILFFTESEENQNKPIMPQQTKSSASLLNYFPAQEDTGGGSGMPHFLIGCLDMADAFLSYFWPAR